jgi:hypothetical protein
MKASRVVCLLVVLLIVANLTAGESQFGIKFGGFVKTDLMYDSRQTVAAREGHFLLYPTGESLDADGEDINARANLNILAIQTRLKGVITGPEAFGAKTSGLIEGAFFGHSNSDINGFRLRHAFMTLTWDNTSLLVGQYWHPMFVTDCFPGTVSFNTGAPFQPFSRNPQVRLTHSIGTLKVIAAAMSQRDFASTGPSGTSSSYLRNSAIPNMHLQLQMKSDALVFGFGGDWKTLAPRLQSAAGYKSEETVSGFSVLGFAKLSLPSLTWKVEATLGQNLTDHLMLGGYAVESVASNTGIETYMPTDVLSVWTDVSSGKKVAFGCFAGYSKNMGASNDIMGSLWGRGTNIDVIYRVSPRIMWTSGKTRFATELEYTAASFGALEAKGTVADADEFVGNLRLLVAAYYFF